MLDMQQQATQNAAEIVKQNQDLCSGACLMGFKISSSCGEVTLPQAIVTIDGQPISNKNLNKTKLVTFPKKELTITSKYTAQITRLFNTFGVKYGDLYVVPKGKVKEIQAKLEAIYQKWHDEVTKLVNRYDAVLAAHIADNQDIASLIKKYALDKQKFANRFVLVYQKPLAINPVFEEDKAEIEAQVTQTLWQSIAADASALYKSSWFSGAKDSRKAVDRVSQAIWAPLDRLAQKLLSLSFEDEKAVGIVKTIDDLRSRLPKRGYIEGHAFEQLTKWVLIMSDEDKLRMHATGAEPFVYEPPVASAPVKEPLSSPDSSALEATPVTPTPRPTPTPIAEAKPAQFDFGTGW